MSGLEDEDAEVRPPQFSLRLMLEIDALLAAIFSVPLLGEALGLVALGLILLMLLQLPFFLLFGAFRRERIR